MLFMGKRRRPVLYQVTMSRSAIKAYRRMPEAMALRIREALEKLAQDQERPDLDIKRLQGRPGYRLRVGGYRVIYDRDDVIRIIAVEQIGPRGSIYH